MKIIYQTEAAGR